jgi:hypothetical protein
MPSAQYASPKKAQRHTTWHHIFAKCRLIGDQRIGKSTAWQNRAGADCPSWARQRLDPVRPEDPARGRCRFGQPEGERARHNLRGPRRGERDRAAGPEGCRRPPRRNAALPVGAFRRARAIGPGQYHRLRSAAPPGPPGSAPTPEAPLPAFVNALRQLLAQSFPRPVAEQLGGGTGGFVPAGLAAGETQQTVEIAGEDPAAVFANAVLNARVEGLLPPPVPYFPGFVSPPLSVARLR